MHNRGEWGLVHLSPGLRSSRANSATLRQMWNALLQPSCLGCASATGPVCAGCAAVLLAHEAQVQYRDGLRYAWAAPHEAPAARLVVALKESGARTLTPLLAALLATALSQVLPARPRQVVLLPIPQRPRNRLRRPADPVVQLARGAAALLTEAGVGAHVADELMWVRGGPDQSRLSAAARQGNVHGALRVRAGVEPRDAVLVDDVVTTGATAREAARAASVAGWRIEAVVSITHPSGPAGVVAARRLNPARVATQSGPSSGIAPGRSPLASQS